MPDHAYWHLQRDDGDGWRIDWEFRVDMTAGESRSLLADLRTWQPKVSRRRCRQMNIPIRRVPPAA